MKKVLIINAFLLIVFISWQYIEYRHEPKIIEILPVTTSEVPSIDPFYPEPLRIAYDKKIMLSDFSYRVNPAAQLEPSIRMVSLRDKEKLSTQKYYAFVLSNKAGLKENTFYSIEVEKKKRNIFDFLQQPKRVDIKTTLKDKSLPKETGEVLDQRLLRQ